MLIDNCVSRFYNFREGVPTANRNTFAGSAASVAIPALRFKSAGAGIESNKLYEVALESCYPDDEQPATTGATIMYFDHVTSFFCQMQGTVGNRALVNSMAFVGIELGTAAQNIIPTSVAGSTQGGVIQLRQWLSDYTKWSLVTFFGVGVPGAAVNQQVDFVVPLINSSGPGGVPDLNAREGHHVGLVYDPFRLKIYAWIDGVMRASLPVGAPWNPIWLAAADKTVIGLLAYSGVQTGATVLDAMWTAPKLHSYNMHALGSGHI